MINKNPNFRIPFMKYRWLLLGISMSLVAVAVYLWMVRGLNYGTDFTGGMTLVYQFKQATDENAVNDTLTKANLPPTVVQRFGEFAKNTFVIKSDIPEAPEQYSKKVTAALQGAFGGEGVQLLKEEFVGPKVGKELRTKGIYAVVWAWVCMLVYIGFRFDFYFAPGAILALIHDVVVTIGAFALMRYEVNLTVVAGILTLIGYSINDTIIVFDRIRENLEKHRGMDLIELVNLSINETLMRTIITSLSVFFVSVVLFFRAEGDIQNFGFVMIFAVITGTYSSVFVAAPIFIFLKQHGHRFGLKKKEPGAVRARA